jgi:hypothetical protein
MTDREAAIKKIAVGDIFHARAINDASFICLALEIREKTIFARRVTTQSIHEFDRVTGIEGPEHSPLVIDSVEPLPDDIREIMLGLDQKYREVEYRQAEDPDWEPPEGSSRLTPEQRRAILFVVKFYPAHPLPPRQ